MNDRSAFPANRAPRNYGNTEPVVAPTAAGQEIVKSILRVETLPVDGRILVVSLDEAFPLADDGFGTPGDTALRFGRLKWRVGRRHQEADFDLKAGGTIFAISADWIEIFVVRQFVFGDIPSIDYEASVTMAWGVPNLWPPTRTVSQVVPAATFSNVLPIPHKAVAAHTSTFASSVTLAIFDGKGLTIGSAQVVVGVINPAPPLTLGQGARGFSVNNPGGASVEISVIFDLGF